MLEEERVRSLSRQVIAQNWGDQAGRLGRLAEEIKFALTTRPILAKELAGLGISGHVFSALENGDAGHALAIATNAIAPRQAAPKHPEKATREARRKTRPRSHENAEDRTIETSSPSRVRNAGRDAHQLIESLILNVHNPKSILAQSARVINTETGPIIEFSVEPAQPQLDQMPPTSNPPKFRPQSSPLLANASRDELIENGLHVIKNNLDRLKEADLAVPQTPEDFVDALQNPVSGPLLLGIFEQAHILFGPDRLCLITNEAINPQNVDVSCGLDWLSVARTLVETVETPAAEKRPQTTTFTEIPIGRPRITLPHDPENNDHFTETLTLQGGTADILDLSLPSAPAQLPFSVVAERLREAFGTQEKRHHRTRLSETGRFETYQTRLSRNTESLFRELWHIYGDIIFTDLRFNLRDLKLIAGDATSDLILDADNPLDPRHVRQVNEYVALIATQLYRVKKWTEQRNPSLLRNGNTNGDDVGDLVAAHQQDIIEFIRTTKLTERFSAQVDYELPRTRRSYHLRLSTDPEDISNWFQETIRPRLIDAETIYQVVAGNLLNRWTSHVAVEEKERATLPIPDELSKVCGVSFEGRPRLILTRLAEELTHPEQGENSAQIVRAVHYRREHISAIWIKNLYPRQTVRLAIKLDRGQFIITDLEGHKLIQGSVATKPGKTKVKESVSAIKTAFGNLLWETLPDDRKTEVAGRLDHYHLINREGRASPRPAGFAAIFTLDPWSHRWILNRSELKRGLTEVKTNRYDPFGLIDWAEAIAEWDSGNHYFRRQLKCPLFTHKNSHGDPNNDTPAASLREGRGHCFGCDENFHLPARPGERLSIPTVPATRLEHYRGVSMERYDNFVLAQTISEICNKYDPRGRQYLQERGLDPTTFTSFGYNSLDLFLSLSHLFPRPPHPKDQSQNAQDSRAATAELQSWIKKNSLSTTTLDRVAATPDCPDPDFYRRVNTILTALEFLPHPQIETTDSNNLTDPRAQVLSYLTIANIRKLRGRGLLRHEFAGRVQFPTYWFPLYPGDSPVLLQSNVTSRRIPGVNPEDTGFEPRIKPPFLSPPNESGKSADRHEEIEEAVLNTLLEDEDPDLYERPENDPRPIGQRLADLTKGNPPKEHDKYLKALSGRKGKAKEVEIDGKKMRIFQEPTPAGVWVRSPREFIGQGEIETDGDVKFNGIPETIIFEGVLNAAAYIQMYPGAKNSVVAISGVGRQIIIPFIREMKVKSVVLALDFDLPGTVAADKLAEEIYKEFGDSVKVSRIYDQLPPEVRPHLTATTTDIKDMLDLYNSPLWQSRSIQKPTENPRQSVLF